MEIKSFKDVFPINGEIKLDNTVKIVGVMKLDNGSLAGNIMYSIGDIVFELQQGFIIPDYYEYIDVFSMNKLLKEYKSFEKIDGINIDKTAKLFLIDVENDTILDSMAKESNIPIVMIKNNMDHIIDIVIKKDDKLMIHSFKDNISRFSIIINSIYPFEKIDEIITFKELTDDEIKTFITKECVLYKIGYSNIVDSCQLKCADKRVSEIKKEINIFIDRSDSCIINHLKFPNITEEITSLMC